MSIHSTAKTPLLKAFLISTLLLVLLLVLLAAGVWRYTAGILSREAALASTLLPDLEVAQRLTAATASLQSQGLLLKTADSLENLQSRRNSLDEAIAITEDVMHSGFRTASTKDNQLDSLLANVKKVTVQLSDVREQELRLSSHLTEEQHAVSDELEKLKSIVQDRVVDFTARLLAGGDALSDFAGAPVGVTNTEYRDSVAVFETNSLQIQDYLLFNQDLVSLQALVERVPLLPSYRDVVVAEQERDLLLRSMVSRAIYFEGEESRTLLMSRLKNIRNRLRGQTTLFTDRTESLNLATTQLDLGELLAEQMANVIMVTENIRAEAESTVKETSEVTLNEIFRYRWFLAGLLLLAVLILVVTNYWLLYRRTFVPLVNITSRLDKVGTDHFTALKPSYFIQEMDELANAVKDLDSVQRIMREKDAELERRNTELARANEDLEQFAHVASHDLQEPLRKLQQFSGLLQQDYGESLDEDGEFYIQAISKSSQRMSSMIRDTLEYARSSRSNQAIEPVNLQELVNLLCLDLDVLVAESGATFDIDPLPTVNANATGMSQLFRNLLVNSMKYKRSDVPVRISIRKHLSSDNSHVVLKIEDNGVGIRQEHLGRVFTPFERLTTTPVRGTGLGLAICQKVCEAHDWTISVSSEVGVGTCFTVVIPCSHLM